MRERHFQTESGTLHRSGFPAMGSPCAIHIDGPRELAEAAARQAETEVHRIETKYSRYLPASLTSEINRCALAGGTIELDDETAALVDYAGRCHQLSGGLFDITSGVLRKAWNFQTRAAPDLAALPGLLQLVGFDKLKWSPPTLGFPVAGMEIDLGGLAKEYAVDRAVAICRACDVESCLVDLGGDIGVGGPRADGSPWTVAIRSGHQADIAAARIELSRGALASSGDYERFIEFEGRRYSHLLNPKTGFPVSGLMAASVTAAQCLAAGTYSSIAMLKGAAGAQWLADCNIPYVLIREDGSRLATPPFRLADPATP